MILAEAKKITGADLVGNSAQGPFQDLKTVWESIKNLPAAPASSEPVQQTIEPVQVSPQPPIPAAQERFKNEATATAPHIPSLSTSQPPRLPTEATKTDNGNKKLLLIGGIAGGAVLLFAIVIVALISGSRSKIDPGPVVDGTSAGVDPGPVADGTGAGVDPAYPNGSSDPGVLTDPGAEDPQDANKNSQRKSETENSITYVVPEKIENFPPRMPNRKLSDFAKEIQKLPFRSKDEFEKTDEYNQKMKAIWPAATLFGQPSLNRFVLLAEHDAEYDADAEKLTLNFSGLTELDTAKVTEFNYFNLTNLMLPESKDKWGRPSDELSIDLNLEPAKAKELIKEIRVAFVVRFGPHESGFSPLGLTNSSSTPFDTVVQGVRIKDTLKQKHYDLWVEECSEVLVFRHDTGEILLDVIAEKQVEQQAEQQAKRQWEEDVAKIVKEFPNAGRVEYKSKFLRLNNLTAITDEQAEILSKLTSLHVSGVTSITDKQAESLGKLFYLNLSGVTSITDKQAEILSNVNNLKMIPECQAMVDKYKNK